jgi:hypothetical protein
MLNRLFDNFSDKTNKSVYHTDTQNQQQDDKKHIKYSSSQHSTFFLRLQYYTQKSRYAIFFYMFKNIVHRHNS